MSERQEKDASAYRPHIAILGSGSGAFACAIRAAEEGARVTMIEHGTLGGTCVNVGCVPSKILLRAGEVSHRRGHHPFAGVPASSGPIDRAALLSQVRGRVEGLRHDKYENILAEYDGIELIHGHARFVDAGSLVLEQSDGGSIRLSPDKTLIATGAFPMAPPIPGLAIHPGGPRPAHWRPMKRLSTWP